MNNVSFHWLAAFARDDSAVLNQQLSIAKSEIVVARNRAISNISARAIGKQSVLIAMQGNIIQRYTVTIDI